MDEDIIVPVAFFLTVIVMGLGIPLVRAAIRRGDRQALPTGMSPELASRLDRLEAMVETVAIEVERMAEGQRFTTRLMTEGAARMVPPPPAAMQPAPVRDNPEVTHA
ncbi:MAG: hypothetical protein IT355_12230 [Gemmatimonadaceae bacterium]|nr:hypothetical protein [Gemmatimonadaceae bacterium]